MFHFGERILVISLDVDTQALRRARKLSSANYLLQADISKLPLRHQFDLVLVRHPDLDLHERDWQIALSAAAKLLTYRGILLITTYSVHEVETLRRWLYRQPLIQFPLEQDRLIPPDIDGQDRFILAYQIHTLVD
jgi:hypothetical protein